jgi:hypothetical protein
MTIFLGFFRFNIVLYTSQNVVHLILIFLVFKPYDYKFEKINNIFEILKIIN